MTSRRAAIAVIAVLMLPGCSGGADVPASSTPTTTSTVATDSTLESSTTTTTTSSTTTTTTTFAGPVGADSIGDPYFPTLGNGGYDVEHYDITMSVDPETGAITSGTTAITATAITDMARFYLDFGGLDVSSVAVDGVAAAWGRVPQKIVVTPASLLPTGETFRVEVAYSGRPRTVTVPSAGIEAGWIVTPEGIYVAAEPNAAHSWFPGNDHPSDKATFTITTTVPTGWVVAANGELVAETTAASGTTFSWVMDHPMATYLAAVAIGEYRRFDTPSSNGVMIRDYLPTDLVAVPPPLTRTEEMIDFLITWFGPYPFGQYGHVVVPDFPGAMENQTMTAIGRGALFERVVVHEIAHQWFGDDVSPGRWSDVWLNEGFATFAEFLWVEHENGAEALQAEIDQDMTRLEASTLRPIADPGVAELFGAGVYVRGGLTLQALRAEVGDDVMRQILTTFAARFSGGNATTADFVSLVNEVSGRDLTDFLSAWLDQADLPSFP